VITTPAMTSSVVRQGMMRTKNQRPSVVAICFSEKTSVRSTVGNLLLASVHTADGCLYFLLQCGGCSPPPFDLMPTGTPRARYIYFVLQQRGTCTGTSCSDIPLIKDESLHAGFSQMNRYQCPGYSTADDDRVTRNIALQ
jgi:hypothetical protein